VGLRTVAADGRRRTPGAAMRCVMMRPAEQGVESSRSVTGNRGPRG
jgi:hypothetical protein